MDKWKPNSGTLRISNLSYGMFKDIYKRGVGFSFSQQEAMFIDQRVFGPAFAKGLFAWDGHVFYMTETGRKFVEEFEGRTAWKDLASRELSHYIKAHRMIRSIRRGPGRSGGVSARAASA